MPVPAPFPVRCDKVIKVVHVPKGRNWSFCNFSCRVSDDFETTYNYAYVSPPSTPPKNGAKQKAEKLSNSTPSPKRNVPSRVEELKSTPSPKRNVLPNQDGLRTPAALTNSEKLRGIATCRTNDTEKCDDIKDICYLSDCKIKDTKARVENKDSTPSSTVVIEKRIDLKSTDIGITDPGDLTDILDTDTDYNGNDANRNTTANILTESDEFNSNFKSTLNEDIRIGAETRIETRLESRSSVLTNNAEIGTDSRSELLNFNVEIRTPIRTPKQTHTCRPSLLQRLLNFHSKHTSPTEPAQQSVITSSITSSKPVSPHRALKIKQEVSDSVDPHTGSHNQSNTLPPSAEITISSPSPNSIVSSSTYLR